MAERAILELYGDIGFGGITAKDFKKQLDRLPKSVGEIELHISSDGGDVFDAVTMYNDLRQHRAKVFVRVNGVAASAASLVAMAGDHIAVAFNGNVMIHLPMTPLLLFPNAPKLRKVASDLEHVTETVLIPTYAARTKKSADEIREMLVAETWMGAEQSVAHGFVDEVFGQVRQINAISPKFAACYQNVPDFLKPKAEAPAQEETPEESPAEEPAAEVVAEETHQEAEAIPCSNLQAFENRLKLLKLVS